MLPSPVPDQDPRLVPIVPAERERRASAPTSVSSASDVTAAEKKRKHTSAQSRLRTAKRTSSSHEEITAETKQDSTHHGTGSTCASRDPSNADATKGESAAGSDQYAQHVSSMSLPQYLKSRPALYYPKDPNTPRHVKRLQIRQDEIAQDPDPTFQKEWYAIGRSVKSSVFNGRFEFENGDLEYLAVKVVLCDSKTMERVRAQEDQETYRNEFENLKAVNHNHIIALVGSFEEEKTPGDRRFGLLLYPLAPTNIKDQLQSMSQHNDSCKQGKIDTCHEKAGFLLSYFACLCRALMWLHRHAYRHQDIKPTNILIDRHNIVVLADFDIAKKYPSRDDDITQSTISHMTEKYAPAHVKNQLQRGSEWDVYSLGCVFLEMSTVIMGETLEAMDKHLICGNDVVDQWRNIRLFYDDALEQGHIHSWMEHLKNSFKRLPQDSPPHELFASPVATARFGSLEKTIEAFFETILSMLNAKTGDRDILTKAWSCFSTFCSQKCEYCHPEVSHHFRHACVGYR